MHDVRTTSFFTVIGKGVLKYFAKTLGYVFAIINCSCRLGKFKLEKH